MKAKLEEGSEAHASLEEEMKSRDADIRTLQASCTDLLSTARGNSISPDASPQSSATMQTVSCQITTGAELCRSCRLQHALLLCLEHCMLVKAVHACRRRRSCRVEARSRSWPTQQTS